MRPLDVPVSRRAALGVAGTCAVHLARTHALAPWVRTLLHDGVRGAVVAREPFGRLEVVAPGVWALISDPFGGDRTTLANGAIIAGRQGVLVVEGLFTPAGAGWLAAQARTLTGRWPTHVVLSHHHGDHVNGAPGYAMDGVPRPRVCCTEATASTVVARAGGDPALRDMLRDVQRLATTGVTALDLGGVTVECRGAAGHTASDMVVLHPEAKVVVGGDLLFHDIFPNYVDATPSVLRAQVAQLPRGAGWQYVPGHGAVMTAASLDRYLALLDAVEAAARAAWERGEGAAAAAAAWRIPESLGTWRLFGPAFLPRAFTAWYQEFDGD